MRAPSSGCRSPGRARPSSWKAIALGLFLYGWNRLRPWVHWGVGLVVGVSGVLSGVFVVCANAWMNSPAGFTWLDGRASDIDPVAAMFNPAWKAQALHMTLSAFEATGFAVAGIHALLLRRRPRSPFHRAALTIALAVGSVAALIQPLSGDWLAKGTAERQPLKLAAMESHFRTRPMAPFVIGGIPDPETQETRYAIEIPGVLSFLAHGDFDAEVKGLEDFPRELWPPLLPVHIAFQVMIGCGMTLAGLGLLFLWLRWKRPHLLYHRRFLMLTVLATPLGFIALEAGWVVTEVGRQPWIIYGIMKTADAVAPMPGLVWPFLTFSAVYLFLSGTVTWLLARHIRSVDRDYPSALEPGADTERNPAAPEGTRA